MKWEPTACKAGDIVRIRLGALYHYGIFVSENEVIQFGLPPTAENRAKEGGIVVCATDIDTFACGCIVETSVFDRGEQRKKNTPSKIIEAARSRLGEGGYNIIHNNCEHFVNECVFGESRCLQEEEIRRRWANRPICGVYLGQVPEAVETARIYPEKRRVEIEKIKNDTKRRDAAFVWSLLETAAKRSFNIEFRQAELKRKLGGKWSCGGFQFDTAVYNGIAAAAVSNSKVALTLSAFPQQGAAYTLKQPRVVISVDSANGQKPDFFWVSDGKTEMLGNEKFV